MWKVATAVLGVVAAFGLRRWWSSVRYYWGPASQGDDQRSSDRITSGRPGEG